MIINEAGRMNGSVQGAFGPKIIYGGKKKWTNEVRNIFYGLMN